MSKLFISYIRHNDIFYVKHNLFEKACHELKIAKFSALDFYDVLNFFLYSTVHLTITLFFILIKYNLINVSIVTNF
jgi:hypothetical protein